MNNRNRCVLAVVLAASAHDASADKVDQCILEGVRNAGEETSAQSVKQNCERLADDAVDLPVRLVEEKNTEDNPYVITPYRQNYVLPYTYVANPNQDPYAGLYSGTSSPMQNAEAKLQLSLKIPLSYRRLFMDNDGIYFGFTMTSFWQVYNSDISAPFRETNYRPEVFYETPIPYTPLGGTLFARLGIEHQSNGRSQELSRSWNRIYVGLGFAKDNWGVYLQPWYRIPEDEKEDDGDPTTPPPAKGDDNPDIQDYLGHYELSGAYEMRHVEFSALARYNFREGNGGFELGMSFPLWGRLKGYVQYYNGYGESLIDYNHYIQRIGVGFLLTDIL